MVCLASFLVWRRFMTSDKLKWRAASQRNMERHRGPQGTRASGGGTGVDGVRVCGETSYSGVNWHAALA